jgi:hypothetical protein
MVLRYMCMMFYDVIYEGSHSKGISMHMLPAKAMVFLIFLIYFINYRNILKVL